MLGKNNYQKKFEQQSDKGHRYALKKLSVGVVSIAVSSFFFVSLGVQQVQAMTGQPEVATGTLGTPEDIGSTPQGGFSEPETADTGTDTEDSSFGVETNNAGAAGLSDELQFQTFATPEGQSGESESTDGPRPIEEKVEGGTLDTYKEQNVEIQETESEVTTQEAADAQVASPVPKPEYGVQIRYQATYKEEYQDEVGNTQFRDRIIDLSQPYQATFSQEVFENGLHGKNVDITSPQIDGYTPDQATVTLSKETWKDAKSGEFQSTTDTPKVIIVEYKPDQVQFKVRHWLQRFDQGGRPVYDQLNAAYYADPKKVKPLLIEGTQVLESTTINSDGSVTENWRTVGEDEQLTKDMTIKSGLRYRETGKEANLPERKIIFDGDHTIQTGLVGEEVEALGLPIQGFTAERPTLTVLPQNTQDSETGEIQYVLDLRYRRNNYTVNFDSGTPALKIRNMQHYYNAPLLTMQERGDQVPFRRGYIFTGWEAYDEEGNLMPELAGYNPYTGDRSKMADPNQVVVMPAHDVTFKALWKANENASYSIHFWAENPDWKEGDNPADRWDYVGRKLGTGTTDTEADLSTITAGQLDWPDIDPVDENDPFEFAKYYTLNQEESNQANAGKTIDGDGSTSYNLYYDRKVYTLIFGRALHQSSLYQFDPTITMDGVKYEPINPYDVYRRKVKFGQTLVVGEDWPNQNQIEGWPARMNNNGWYLYGAKGPVDYRDAPPYTLNKEQFIQHGPYKNEALGIRMQPDEIYLGIMAGTNTVPVHFAYNIETVESAQARYEAQIQGKAIPDPVYVTDPSVIENGIRNDTSAPAYKFPGPEVDGFTLVNPHQGAKAIKGANRWAAQGLEEKYGPYIAVGENGVRYNENRTVDYYYQRKISHVEFIPDSTKPNVRYGLDQSLPNVNSNNTLSLAYQTDLTKIDLPTMPKYPDPIDIPSLPPSKPGSDAPAEVQAEYEAAMQQYQQAKAAYEAALVAYHEAYAKVKEELDKYRPADVPEDYEFKGWGIEEGWAINSGVIDDNRTNNEVGGRRDHVPSTSPLTLYAKWGAPDAEYTVLYDFNGGTMQDHNGQLIKEGRYKVKYGDKIAEPSQLEEPTREGYDFIGWEYIVEDNDSSQRDTPLLYSFDNRVNDHIRLRAMWEPHQKTSVTVKHEFYDNRNFTGTPTEIFTEEIDGVRVGSYWSKDAIYAGEDYVAEHRFGVITDVQSGAELTFKYRPYLRRQYTISYVDQNGNKLLDDKKVTNGNRHYDADHYVNIPGYQLVEQASLTADEKNKYGINQYQDSLASQYQFEYLNEGLQDGPGIPPEKGFKRVYVYQDKRVIQRDVSQTQGYKPEDHPVPEGYTRVIIQTQPEGKLAYKDSINPSPQPLVFDVHKSVRMEQLPDLISNGNTHPDPAVNAKPNEGYMFKDWVRVDGGTARALPQDAAVLSEPLYTFEARYSADDQKAYLRFIDTTNDNKVIYSLVTDGKTGETGSFTNPDTLNDQYYENLGLFRGKGYAIQGLYQTSTTDNIPANAPVEAKPTLTKAYDFANEFTFDTDKTQHQVFDVYMEHRVVPILTYTQDAEGNNQKTWGTNIDGNNLPQKDAPYGDLKNEPMLWPKKVDPAEIMNQFHIQRKVNHYQGGTTTPIADQTVQTLYFEAPVYMDMVTGDYIYDWGDLQVGDGTQYFPLNALDSKKTFPQVDAITDPAKYAAGVTGYWIANPEANFVAAKDVDAKTDTKIDEILRNLKKLEDNRAYPELYGTADLFYKQVLVVGEPHQAGEFVDPNANDLKNEPTWGPGLTETDLKESVQRTIRFQKQDGSQVDGSQVAPDYIQTLNFQRKAHVNPWTYEVLAEGDLTGVAPYTDWEFVGTAGQNIFPVLTDKEIPKLAGYTATKLPTASQAVSATDTDTTHTVIYTPDPQKAVVNFVDTDVNKGENPQLASIDLSGVTDQNLTGATEYATIQTQINELLKRGYKVQKNPLDGTQIFDKDGSVDQSYQISMVHRYEPIADPGNLPTPGELVNSEDPNSPKWPTPEGDIQTPRDYKRTIKFVDEAGTELATSVEQTIYIEAKVSIDLVTGKYYYDYNKYDTEGIPEPYVMEAVPAKAIDGYVPKSATYDGQPAEGTTVPALTIEPHSTENFTKEGQIVYVQLITVQPNNPKTGGDPIDPAQPDGPKWPADVDQAGLNKTIQRRIDYVVPVGFEAQKPANVTQDVTYTRTARVNPLTGEVVDYSDWTSTKASHDQVNTPLVTGLIADTASVPEKTHVAVTDTDTPVTVTYKKLGQVKPQLKTEGITNPVNTDANKLPAEMTYPNHPTDPTKVGQPTIPVLADHTPVDASGLALELADPTDPSKGYKVPVPTDPTQDVSVFYVPFAQLNKTDISFDKPITGLNPDQMSEEVVRTITYVVKNGTATAPEAKTDKLTFSRQAVVDTVNNKFIRFNEWTADKGTSFEAVTSPTVANHFVDKPEVLANDNAKADDPDISVIVTYAKEIILDGDNPKTTTDLVDPNDPTNTTKFGQGLTKNDLRQDVKRTIKYIKAEDSSTVHRDEVQTVTFDRKAVVNPWTGQAVSYTEWTPATATVNAVNSPNLEGYSPDKVTVEAHSFKQGDPDATVTVIYAKHLIIPADQAKTPGQPINAQKPEGPKWPAETAQDQLNKTIQRTITHDVPADWTGTKPVDEVQKVDFTRSAIVNPWTGEFIKHTDWEATKDSYDSYKAPVVTGLVADKANVDGKAGVTVNDTDSIETITYSELGQLTFSYKREGITNPVNSTATLSDSITYPNDPDDATQIVTTNTVIPYVKDHTPVVGTKPLELVDPTDPSQGYKMPRPESLTGDTAIEYIPFAQLTPGNFNESHTPAGFDVTSLTDTVTQTIHYVDESNNKLSQPTTETLTFKRTAVVDTVNNAFIRYNDWTTDKDNFDAVKAHLIEGYLATVAQLEAVPNIKAGAEDITQKIVYKKLGQVTAQFDTVGLRNPLPSNQADLPCVVTYPNDAEDVTKAGQPTIKYIPNHTPVVNGLALTPVDSADLSKGYIVPVPNNPSEDVTVSYVPFDQLSSDELTPTNRPKLFDPETLRETVTRTIKYVFADGSSAWKTEVQSLNFTRKVIVDTVNTSFEGYTPWQPTEASLIAVNSPIVPGFIADQAQVPGVVNVPVTAEDSRVTVIYRELGRINTQYDSTGISNPVPSNPEDLPEGTSYPNDSDNPSQAKGTTIGYVTNHTPVMDGQPLKPVNPGDPTQGYIVPVPDNPTESITVSYIPFAQPSVEELKHMSDIEGLDPNALNKKVIQRIYFVDEMGNPLAENSVQQIDFSRNAVIDTVNQKLINYKSWTPATKKMTFDPTPVPIIPGYIANKTVVPGTLSVIATDEDRTETVSYQRIGQVVTEYQPEGIVNPVPSKDSELPAATTYPNHPTDPTQVSQPVIAYVPNHTPVSNGVALTPVDSTDLMKGYLVPVPNDVRKDLTVSYVPFAQPNAEEAKVMPDIEGLNPDDLVQTVTRTVHFVDETGAPLKADALQQLDFNRTAVVDTVHKTLVGFNEWTADDTTFQAVQVPVVAGYITQVREISAQTDVTAVSSDQSVDVIFASLGEMQFEVERPDGSYPAAIPAPNNFQYPNHPSDPSQIGKFTLPYYDNYVAVLTDTREPLTLIDPANPALGYYMPEISDPTLNCNVLYVALSLVSPDQGRIPGQPISPSHPDITWPNQVSPDLLQKEITRTIHLVDESGQALQRPIVQRLHFTRKAIVNPVTGEFVGYTDFAPSTQSFDAVTLPDIVDYTCDQDTVPSLVIDALSTPIEVTATYRHIASGDSGTPSVPIKPHVPSNPDASGEPGHVPSTPEQPTELETNTGQEGTGLPGTGLITSDSSQTSLPATGGHGFDILPETGETEPNYALFSAAALSLLSGLGLLKGKKSEEEDEA